MTGWPEILRRAAFLGLCACAFALALLVTRQEAGFCQRESAGSIVHLFNCRGASR